MTPIYQDPAEGKVAPEHKLFVGGHWLEGNEWFEIQDKISGDVLASVPSCDDELFDMAVLAARDALEPLCRLSPDKRADRLRQWSEAILLDRAEMARIVCRESAVPAAWAELEVEQAAEVLRLSAIEAQRIVSESIASAPMPERTAAPLDIRFTHPVGSVAAVLPDRHALFSAAKLVGAALAVGCPAIILSGDRVALAVRRMVEAGSRLDWPAGSITLLYGARSDLGVRLAADARVALLMIAGEVAEYEALVAARKGHAVCAHGTGFSCAVLDRQADLGQVVDALVVRRFQTPAFGCPVPTFILAPQDLAPGLQEVLAARLAALSGADLEDIAALVPWQVTDKLAQRAEDWLAEFRKAGGTIVCGGRRKGAYVQPTLVSAPVGYEPIMMPPPDAPFFVMDSYAKQPDRHLHRIAGLAGAMLFSPSAASALSLANRIDVGRLDIFAARPGQKAGTTDRQGSDQLRSLVAGLTKRKQVQLHIGT